MFRLMFSGSGRMWAAEVASRYDGVVLTELSPERTATALAAVGNDDVLVVVLSSDAQLDPEVQAVLRQAEKRGLEVMVVAGPDRLPDAQRTALEDLGVDPEQIFDGGLDALDRAVKALGDRPGTAPPGEAFHLATKLNRGKDSVALGGAAPPSVEAGAPFIIRVVAYPTAEADAIKEMLNEIDPEARKVIGTRRTRWARGTEVTVRVRGEGFQVDPSEQGFEWDGEPQILDFAAQMNPRPSASVVQPRLEYWVFGVRVAIVVLQIHVAASASMPSQPAMPALGPASTGAQAMAAVTAAGPWSMVSTAPVRTAFASYSSEDRDRVLERVSALRSVADIDVFTDCTHLRVGDKFKDRLMTEILRRERFLLFWSENARTSSWVDWEWRTALRLKGMQSIQPQPLDSGSHLLPPIELAELNFHDPLMVIRRAVVDARDRGL